MQVYLSRFLINRVDLKLAGEVGVHFGFWKPDNFGRDLDKWQTALPHEVVNCPAAYV